MIYHSLRKRIHPCNMESRYHIDLKFFQNSLYIIKSHKTHLSIASNINTNLQPYSFASLKAVITILNPFPAVPHESVLYFSVTKLVKVKRIPSSPIVAGVSEHDIFA